MTSDEIVRWGDDAQYYSKPIVSVRPKAYLLWATPDPLGAIAAVAKMFKGEPVYSLSEVTDREREDYWRESFKSHLRAPHEFVQFHFMVEGVTRAHTHQMVRQRTATFAQESLRFAVKENLVDEIALPPSIVDGSGMDVVWRSAIESIQKHYKLLVDSGIPAEDARGLLPHATTTRLHWRTNLADLIHHAGNRLCTQAQFEWRYLMMEVTKAIRGYGTDAAFAPGELHNVGDDWQFQIIGSPSPQTFAPICFQTGKCEFRAIFDRPCSIRDRVDRLGEDGVPSSEWTKGAPMTPRHGLDESDQIGIEEWMMDSSAAR